MDIYKDLLRKTACIIIVNPIDNTILGVSRKDNYNDIGLIGGKADDTDASIEAAAIRECKEETGLDIFNLQLLDVREYQDTYCHLYLADYDRTKSFYSQEESMTKKEGIVKWATETELFNSKFGDYNIAVFETYKDKIYGICS